MATKFGSVSSNIYTCSHCDYTTQRASQYCRHLSTAKHKSNSLATHLVPKVPPPIYECLCSKTYKDRTGLWRHQQKCYAIKPTEPAFDNITAHNAISSSHANNIIFELLKQNQEFKDLIIEQNDKMFELSKQTQEHAIEQNKNIMELAGKVGNVTNNNITTQNNQFNLQIFLNETCKDAVNINDFIKDLPVSFQQLENIGRNGYVAGITDVILTQLKSMDITKRPLHCTDLKRDTMYIKNTNEWVKDDNDNTMMTQIFRRIAKHNLNFINEWSKQHPNSQISDSTENVFCMNVMLNSLGANGDAQLKLDNKVLKSISKFVHLADIKQ